MKKVTLMLGLFICLVGTAQQTELKSTTAGNKLDLSKIATTGKQIGISSSLINRPIAYIAPGSDTLIVLDSCKFIKIGDNVFTPQQLKEKGFYFTQIGFIKMFEGMQEYPAKIANPITEYLKKFFGVN